MDVTLVVVVEAVAVYSPKLAMVDEKDDLVDIRQCSEDSLSRRQRLSHSWSDFEGPAERYLPFLRVNKHSFPLGISHFNLTLQPVDVKS